MHLLSICLLSVCFLIVSFDPILTYGRIKQPKQDVVLPDYVTFDRIVLKFRGYFKQLIPGLQQQNTYRTRYVNVMYFMEDDTMTVMEPPVMVRLIFSIFVGL